MKFSPYEKGAGEAEKVLAMLEGGTRFWGPFLRGSLRF